MQYAALVLVFVAIAHANAAETLLSQVPAKYMGLLNQQVKDELNKMSMKEVNALKKAAMRASDFTSLAEARSAFQQASPYAYAMASQYGHLGSTLAITQFNQLKSRLSPSSLDFFVELGALGHNFASQAHQLLQRQSAATKANLGQAFPSAKVALNTPAGRVMAEHLQKML